MSRRVRQLMLTVHVVCSVGWLGAVCASLALAVAALTTGADRTMRGLYLALEVVGWYALVPLSLASLVSGLVQSLGTPWGLVRHWWVVLKLAMTVVAVLVLGAYTQTLAALADAARPRPASAAGAETLPSLSPVVHAVLALLLLIATTALAVYKPSGVTRWGRRAEAALG